MSSATPPSATAAPAPAVRAQLCASSSTGGGGAGDATVRRGSPSADATASPDACCCCAALRCCAAAAAAAAASASVRGRRRSSSTPSGSGAYGCSRLYSRTHPVPVCKLRTRKATPTTSAAADESSSACETQRKRNATHISAVSKIFQKFSGADSDSTSCASVTAPAPPRSDSCVERTRSGASRPAPRKHVSTPSIAPSRTGQSHGTGNGAHMSGGALARGGGGGAAGAKAWRSARGVCLCAWWHARCVCGQRTGCGGGSCGLRGWRRRGGRA